MAPLRTRLSPHVGQRRYRPSENGGRAGPDQEIAPAAGDAEREARRECRQYELSSQFARENF